ncbi:MAG: hypothetical protein QM770_22665 [Tepidisphaeraceae bacterium]
MDLSKLKKWSNENAPPPPTGEAPVDAPISHQLPSVAKPVPTPVRRNNDAPRPASPGAYAGVFISLVLGLLFTMLGLRFAKWLVAYLQHKPFETGFFWNGDTAKPVPYWELAGQTAWTEAAIFAMGVALLLDAVVVFLATRNGIVRKPLVMLAMGITALALLLNLGLGGYLFSIGVIPIYSVIALLVAGFMLFDHWALMNE